MEALNNLIYTFHKQPAFIHLRRNVLIKYAVKHLLSREKLTIIQRCCLISYFLSLEIMGNIGYCPVVELSVR